MPLASDEGRRVASRFTANREIDLRLSLTFVVIKVALPDYIGAASVFRDHRTFIGEGILGHEEATQRMRAFEKLRKLQVCIDIPFPSQTDSHIKTPVF